MTKDELIAELAELPGDAIITIRGHTNFYPFDELEDYDVIYNKGANTIELGE